MVHGPNSTTLTVPSAVPSLTQSAELITIATPALAGRDVRGRRRQTADQRRSGSGAVGTPQPQRPKISATASSVAARDGSAATPPRFCQYGLMIGLVPATVPSVNQRPSTSSSVNDWNRNPFAAGRRPL